MIFSVNIPEDGVYPVTLFAYACESKVLLPSMWRGERDERGERGEK